MLLLLSVVGILYLLYRYFTKDNDYFKKQGLPYEKPVVLLGNRWRTFIYKKYSLFDHYQRFYKLAKPFGIGGIFETTKPAYIIADPELIKNITIKDFEHFMNHTDFTSEGDIFHKTLFALKDNKWKDVRGTLSPAFTGNKMRHMYELIEKCATTLEKYLENQLKNEKSGIVKKEVKELFGRCTIDAIATSAYGIEVDSINNPKNEFLIMGKDLVDFSSGFRWLKTPVAFLAPRLVQWIWSGGLFSEKAVQFFRDIFMENINIRRNKGVYRPDMIQLMTDAVKEAKLKHQKEELTDEEMLAQAILFFFGGFNTISDTLSFLFHHLAEHPEVQEKLYREIEETLQENDGVMNYEILMKMPYLEMVINESQRIQPVVAFIDRQCVKKYTIPAKGDRSEVTIHPGDMLFLLPYSMHHDPEYFEDPEKFIPERFSDENKSKINPYTYFPFGLGPRQCIANRFAKMELKIVAFHILKKFEITFIEETEHPLQLSPNGNGTDNQNGFWLGFKSRG